MLAVMADSPGSCGDIPDVGADFDHDRLAGEVLISKSEPE
jgi:hypothetical protein